MDWLLEQEAWQNVVGVVVHVVRQLSEFVLVNPSFGYVEVVKQLVEDGSLLGLRSVSKAIKQDLHEGLRDV